MKLTRSKPFLISILMIINQVLINFDFNKNKCLNKKKFQILNQEGIKSMENWKKQNNEMTSKRWCFKFNFVYYEHIASHIQLKYFILCISSKLILDENICKWNNL